MRVDLFLCNCQLLSVLREYQLRQLTSMIRVCGTQMHLERRLYDLLFTRNKLLPVFPNLSILEKSGYFSDPKALAMTFLSLTVLHKQTTSGFSDFFDLHRKWKFKTVKGTAIYVLMSCHFHKISSFRFSRLVGNSPYMSQNGCFEVINGNLQQEKPKIWPLHGISVTSTSISRQTAVRVLCRGSTAIMWHTFPRFACLPNVVCTATDESPRIVA
jgi:hypothetical protein